jgi:predicted transcriptional regulator YdeE
VEADDNADIPSEYDVCEIPVGMYAVFAIEQAMVPEEFNKKVEETLAKGNTWVSQSEEYTYAPTGVVFEHFDIRAMLGDIYFPIMKK